MKAPAGDLDLRAMVEERLTPFADDLRIATHDVETLQDAFLGLDRLVEKLAGWEAPEEKGESDDAIAVVRAIDRLTLALLYVEQRRGGA